MPTFAFPRPPQSVTFLLHRTRNAPLPVALLQIHSFGIPLNARLLSMPDRSTSELLRTL